MSYCASFYGLMFICLGLQDAKPVVSCSYIKLVLNTRCQGGGLMFICLGLQDAKPVVSCSYVFGYYS